MLYRIENTQDPLFDLVKDDPVRPAIPRDLRTHEYADTFVLLDGTRPRAVTCVAYLDQVPRTERELGIHGRQVAAFYTIWSYELARRFHHKNGAVTLSDNDDTVNYEYR